MYILHFNRTGELARGEIFSCHPYPEKGHIQNHPKAMERKENVPCTFLENRRAGAREIFSCHPYPEQDHNHCRPMDDN